MVSKEYRTIREGSGIYGSCMLFVGVVAAGFLAGLFAQSLSIWAGIASGLIVFLFLWFFLIPLAIRQNERVIQIHEKFLGGGGVARC